MGVLLLFLVIQHFQCCDVENMETIKMLRESKPELRPVSTEKIGIFWAYNLTESEIECLRKVELYERNGRSTIATLEAEKNETQAGEPFKVKLDICHNNFNRFQLKYYFENKKNSIDSKFIEYKPPSYFNDSALPPFCMKNNNLTVLLLENVVKQHKFYKKCIKKVEVCPCKATKDNCEDMCQNYYDPFEIQSVYSKKAPKYLRLYYSRQNMQRHSHGVGATITLELKDDHCDPYFMAQAQQTTEANGLSSYALAGGGTVAGVLLFMVIVIIVVFVTQ